VGRVRRGLVKMSDGGSVRDVAMFSVPKRSWMPMLRVHIGFVEPVRSNLVMNGVCCE
jgi:hypothetical protein